MHLKNLNKSSVTRLSIGILKFIAFVLFVFCFYYACKITTP